MRYKHWNFYWKAKIFVSFSAIAWLSWTNYCNYFFSSSKFFTSPKKKVYFSSTIGKLHLNKSFYFSTIFSSVLNRHKRLFTRLIQQTVRSGMNCSSPSLFVKSEKKKVERKNASTSWMAQEKQLSRERKILSKASKELLPRKI